MAGGQAAASVVKSLVGSFEGKEFDSQASNRAFFAFGFSSSKPLSMANKFSSGESISSKRAAKPISVKFGVGAG